MATRKNTQQGNPRQGLPYRVQPTSGGVYHVYADGRKVFVPISSTPAPSAAAAPDQQAQIEPDSQYVSNAAENTFKVNEQLGQNTLAGTTNRSNYEEALRRLQGQQPRDEQSATESANNAGLYYSGHLGRKLGDIATAYARKQSDLRGNFDTQEAARLSARQTLEAGYTLDDAAYAAQNVDRQVTGDTGAADTGSLVPEAPAAAPVAPAAPRPPAIKARKPRVPARRKRRIRT